MTAQPKSLPFALLLATLATVGVCDVAFGLTFQLQPLLLERQGVAAWMIGLIISMGPLGILLAGPFLPNVIARLGGRRVALLAIMVIAASLSGMAVLDPFYWWFLLRFALGIATGTLFTLSETWMISISDESNRGRVMGVYTSFLSVTFAIGPMLLPFTGVEGPLPWIICITFVLLSLIPLYFVRIAEASKDGGKGSVFGVIRQAPLLFASIAAATLFDSVMISFFTIFATRRGVELSTASTLLGTGIISGVVLFYPIGVWADRWSRNGVVLATAISTVICCVAMIYLVNTIFIWPLVILLMNSAFGVYVVGLALIGDAFKGKDVVAGSAAVAAMWGAGGIAGPPVAGKMIDLFGINAFPLTMAGFYLALVVVLLGNGGRVLRNPA